MLYFYLNYSLGPVKNCSVLTGQAPYTLQSQPNIATTGSLYSFYLWALAHQNTPSQSHTFKSGMMTGINAFHWRLSESMALLKCLKKIWTWFYTCWPLAGWIIAETDTQGAQHEASLEKHFYMYYIPKHSWTLTTPGPVWPLPPPPPCFLTYLFFPSSHLYN